MRHWFIWAFLVVVLAAGCQQQEAAPGTGGAWSDSASTSMPPPSPRGPGPMSDLPTNPAVIADTGDVNATLGQLTQELRDYVVRTRSVPKDFEEFATKSQVRFPPAPAGKKYALAGQAVVLVKR